MKLLPVFPQKKKTKKTLYLFRLIVYALLFQRVFREKRGFAQFFECARFELLLKNVFFRDSQVLAGDCGGDPSRDCDSKFF